MSKYPADKIKTLPEAVQDNFYSGEINEKYVDEIFPLFAEDEVAAAKDLIMDVYYKAVTPSAFPAALAAIVKDPAKAKEATSKILGYDFLPIADYLGEDVLTVIEKNGGNPLIYRSQVPVRDVVERVVGKAGVVLEEERLEQRMENILRSFVAGARKDEQVLEMLKGNSKTSGVGLSEDQALTLIALAKAEKELLEKRGVDIIADQVFDQQAGAAPAVSLRGVEDPEAIPSEDVVPEASHEEIQQVIADLPAEDLHALASIVRTEEVPQQPVAAVSRASDAFSAEDAEDIVIHQKRLPEKVDVKVIGQVTSLEDGLAEEIVTMADVHLPNDDIRNRFLYAVKLYIRDIRDALETKSKLTTPITGGGIGMSDTEASRVMTLVTTKLKDLRSIMADRAQKAKDTHVSAGVDRHVNGSDDIAKAEQANRDALYQTLTGKTPHEAAAKEQGVAVLAERKPVQPQVTRVIPVVGKDEPHVPDLSKLSVPVIHEVGSHVVAPASEQAPVVAPPQENLVVAAPKVDVAAPVAAPVPAAAIVPPKRVAPPPDALPVVEDDDESLVVREVGDSMDIGMKEKIGSVPTSPAPVSRTPSTLASIVPPPAPVVVPPPVVALVALPKPVSQPIAPTMTAAPAVKQTVSDVSYAPKLTGPTDALRSMTIVDFRRLSKDPKEATLKIKDKIDLLADESFERKTEGIKAWQASESNKTYLSMLRASLEGEPLVQVITKLQNASQPVLTKEEFDAIMELNRDLRFG